MKIQRGLEGKIKENINKISFLMFVSKYTFRLVNTYIINNIAKSSVHHYFTKSLKLNFQFPLDKNGNIFFK